MRIVQKKLSLSDSYSLFEINILKLNEYLVFDLYIKKDQDYIIIIEVGTLLSQKLYEKLQAQDKIYIRTEDINKHKLSCNTLQSHIKANFKDFKKSFDLLYNINNKLFASYSKSEDNYISIPCVKELVKSIIFLVQSDKGFLRNIMACFVNEHELSTHSLNVCIYSISLGNVLKIDNDELLKLGIASLLHDLGLKKINIDESEKHKKYSIEELEIVKKHTKYSVDIVKHNRVFDPYIIDSILHHHENYDGSGYPDGLIGREINSFSSIISIADVFDALTNVRSNREAYSSFNALSMMMKDETLGNKFNHQYVKVFLVLL